MSNKLTYKDNPAIHLTFTDDGLPTTTNLSIDRELLPETEGTA